MAQYIKVVPEPGRFKMFARLEKGAKPFPESQRDSYWEFDFDVGESYCRDRSHRTDDRLVCASKFVDIIENESDANANGVFRLKVGQTLVKFTIRENATRYTPRKISVCARGPERDFNEHEYHFVEISAADAAEECPEILDWNAAPAPSAPLAAAATKAAAVFAREETMVMLAREEITLLREEIAALRSEMDARLREEIAVLHSEMDARLREEIAALRSEMDARQKRTDAIMVAAIHNLDEKISAK